MTTLEIRKETAGLSLPERIQLVEDLWDDIGASDKDWSLSDAQKTELNQRVAEFERNPREGVSWAEAKREILRQRRAVS